MIPATPKPQEISKEKLENLHLISKEEQADLRRQLDDTITYYERLDEASKKSMSRKYLYSNTSVLIYLSKLQHIKQK